MRQLVRLSFEFTADDENDAGIMLEAYFAGKYDGRNTVSFQTSVDEVGEIMEELFDEDARYMDIDGIFNEYNVSVSKVEIQAPKKPKLGNFKESRIRSSRRRY